MKTGSLTFAISFICYSFLSSQTERGSWMLNTTVAVDKNLGEESDIISTSFTPTFGYFIADGLLVGTYLSYYYANLGNGNNASTLSLSPFLRYYIQSNNSWSWFTTIGYSYNKSQIEFYSFNATPKYHSLYGGIGHNCFLNVNTAIEGILQFQYDFNEIVNLKNLLYNAGLQFFLPVTKTENTTTTVGKGTRLIGLTANAGWVNMGVTDDLYLSVNPVIGFFLTNKLVLGSGLFLAFANQNAIFEPQPFARYYIGILGANFQPFATAGVETRFQFADKAGEASFFNFNLNGGLGVDLFLTPTVALEGIVKYEGRQVEDAASKQQFLRVQVGLQFFLGVL